MLLGWEESQKNQMSDKLMRVNFSPQKDKRALISAFVRVNDKGQTLETAVTVDI